MKWKLEARSDLDCIFFFPRGQEEGAGQWGEDDQSSVEVVGEKAHTDGHTD